MTDLSVANAANKQAFDVEAVRRDFPILSQQVNGKPLMYLDNGASAQKPTAVLDAMDRYYREIHSNVHRGAHTLADRATGEAQPVVLRGGCGGTQHEDAGGGGFVGGDGTLGEGRRDRSGGDAVHLRCAGVGEADVDAAIDDLRGLKGGLIDRITIHAIDRDGDSRVVAVNARQERAFWRWRAGEDEPSRISAERIKL